MRKIPVIGAVVFALLLMTGACAKKYDSAKVKGTMKELGAAMKDAAKYGNPLTADFTKAKPAFQAVKAAFLKLQGVKAPKGEQKEWDSIHKNGIEAAEKGIKACDAKDKKALSAALVDLGKAAVEGHTKFR